MFQCRRLVIIKLLGFSTFPISVSNSISTEDATQYKSRTCQTTRSAIILINLTSWQSYLSTHTAATVVNSDVHRAAHHHYKLPAIGLWVV